MPGFEEKIYETQYLPRIREVFHREQRLPDVFVRYGLELEEDDTAAIKARTAAVQLYWARKSHHPTDGILYKTLHGDVAGRQRIENPEARKLARVEIRDERTTRERDRLRTLDRWITIAATDGYLTSEAVTSLVTRLAGLGFDEALIRQRISGIPVRAGNTVDPPDEGLPESTRKQIQTSLTLLNLADIYAFLSVAPDASSEVWKERYGVVHDKARKAGVGPRAEATNRLLGIIKQYLLENPAAYARAREFNLAQSLEPQVQQLGINGTISERGYEALLTEGLELGLTDKSCARAIKWLASRNNIAVHTKTDGNSASVTLCPACHRLIQASEIPQSCPHCAESLWTKCPECSGRVLASSSACTLCGFPIERRTFITSLLQLGADRLQAGDLRQALCCLEDLEEAWRGGEVAQLRRRFEQARSGIEQLASRFHSALAAKSIYLARDILSQLRAAGAPTYDFRDGSTFSAFEAALNQRLSEIETILASAHAAQLAGEANKAVALFSQALSRARDCVEAQEGLSRCPPEPVCSLRLTLGADSILLQWQPSPAFGTIEYVIRTREDHAPRNIKDGAEAAVISEHSWEDRTLAPGATRFYSVFTRRGTAVSAPVCTPEVLGRFEVRDLHLSSHEGRVSGSWQTLPPVAHSVVLRRLGGNVGGSPLPIPSHSSGFTDSAVTMDTEYEYSVAVEYTVGGRTIRTPGVVARAVLEAAPDPVTELHLRQKSTSLLEISWKGPARGNVDLFALLETPRLKPGTAIEPSALQSWSQFRVPHAGNTAQWSRPSSRPRFLTAVTVLNNHAVMGPSVLDIQDVSGLEGTNLGNSIRLIWEWPEGCDTALVVWRHDRFPASPDERPPAKHEVTRGGYGLSRGFHIADPEPKTYFVTVFAGVHVDGQLHYGGGSSEGARVKVRAARRVPITYTIKKSFLSKRNVLQIESGVPGTVLPELKLICNSTGRQPIRSDDGQPILHIRNKLSPFQTDFLLPASGYLRLFLADGKQSEDFQVIDPSPSTLDRTK